eukprot:TRINITY_DN2993_c0_g1_i1.p1 TRINITY_DN2993_c0_g1~~TRINITY_DN2993_c0_g1_i1.p1  ORF type:complete len:730 (-),score=293.83 TRINITY_DN2993_c0_g1_i1:308-2497(-)
MAAAVPPAVYMAGHDYGWALSRIPELEVDLASAVAGLERSQADNATLKDVHLDLANAYKRLQEQHERLRVQLRREQDDRQQLAHDHQQQVAAWRMQMEAKAKDLEMMQRSMPAPGDLENMRLQLAEEIAEPFKRQVQELEGRVRDEQKKATELHRAVELQRVQGSHREGELKEEQAEQQQRHKQREQALKAQVEKLEAEVRKGLDTAAASAQLKAQLQEQESKAARLRLEMEELEGQAQREQSAAAEAMRTKVEELSAARRRSNEAEAQLNQEERKIQMLQSELDGLRRDKGRLQLQVEQCEARLQDAESRRAPAEEPERLQAELAKLRGQLASEREQHAQALRAVQEQHHSCTATVKRLEARLQSAEDERGELEKEAQKEKAELERSHTAELSALKGQLQASEQELDAKKSAWQKREAALQQQVKDETARAESLTDELAQCQFERDALQRAKSESRQKISQLEHAAQAEKARLEARLESELRQLPPLQEKVQRLEKTEDLLRKSDARVAALQTELSVQVQKLDGEREKWAREADEAAAAATKTEEQRRQQAVQKLTEEHRRHFAKYQVAAKKALQKGSRKRQELKTRCQELAKRVSHLQQEKAAAIRICEENKGAYELRLAELGLPLQGSSPYYEQLKSSAAAGVAGHTPTSARRELQAISERLERHAEWLRTSSASRSSAAVRSSSAGAVASAPAFPESPTMAKAAPAQAVREDLLRASNMSNPQGR